MSVCSRPGWSRSDAALCAVRRAGRRSAASAALAGLGFAGNGARRCEDIGVGGEPIGLLVM